MAGLARAIARALMAALIGAAMAGCAQHPDKVAVGIGTAAYTPEYAAPFAALYLPYARMATLAYTDKEFLGGRAGPYCPDAELLNAAARADGDNAEAHQQLARWLTALKRDWKCISGAIGPLDCPPGIRCVDGLQYQVWRRNDCGEAVIAFRGTDSGDIGDWVTNLRWIVVRPVFDQYDQLQKAIHGIIDDIYTSGCRPKRIIATGHSLGGGLGQHVAFADARIAYVYAFAPSPVTAFFSVPIPTRMEAVGQLGIDRIYERGEILSLPRYLVSGIHASSPCRPRVRIVRFATTTAPGRIERHRIVNLTRSLETLAETHRHARLPVAFREAKNCTFAG